MKDKKQIQDFKVLKITLPNQTSLHGGTGSPPATTEHVINTADPNSPTGFSDDCSNSADNSTPYTGGNIIKAKTRSMVD